MGNVKQFFVALAMFPKAFRFVSQHRLWRYTIAPAALSLILVLLLAILVWSLSGSLSDFVFSFLSLENPESGWEKFLVFTARILIGILLLVIYFRFYKLLMLNLMAPLLYFLASKVLSILYGQPEDMEFKFGAFMRQLGYDIFYAIKVFLKETALIVAIVLLALIFPPISPIAPVILVLIESYFIGLSMTDYTVGYKELSIADGKLFRKKYRGFALGNGLGFYLLFLVPVAGVLFAPSLAAVASAIGIFRLENKN